MNFVESTEFVKYFVKSGITANCLLCYHFAIGSRVTERNIKLILVHASVIYQILSNRLDPEDQQNTSSIRKNWILLQKILLFFSTNLDSVNLSLRGFQVNLICGLKSEHFPVSSIEFRTLSGVDKRID